MDEEKKPKKKRYRVILLIISIMLLITGVYILLLTQSASLPSIPFISTSSIDLDITDDVQDKRNRIQISKINLEVPFNTGAESVLNEGVWHRFPERGDPEKGGNFILSAHRFQLYSTITKTKTKSPFYNVHKLNVGDEIKVFYNDKWYKYKITKKYEVKPSETSIEESKDEAVLTLYTCTFKGSTDGRTVIEAKPVKT